MADGPSLATLYSTADAASVGRYVAAHYPVGVVRCEMLRRGFNDSYEVEAAGDDRFVFRLGTLRARGQPNVDYETALLAFLKGKGVSVAEPFARCDGSLWGLAATPEGDRPTVLFRFVPGRDPDPGSPFDAAAQGATLAGIHAAAVGYDGPPSRYRLDLDHLLHGPLAAFLALPMLPDADRPLFTDLAARLDLAVSERARSLAGVACHGDTHGGNARIEETGPLGRRASFFDFDDGGPGWLAYDLAVFRWSRALGASSADSQRSWPAFLDGYQTVRPIAAADLDAVPFFVAIRHFWLLGEYARRFAEWGRESLPAVWIKRQADFLRRWDETELSGRLF